MYLDRKPVELSPKKLQVVMASVTCGVRCWGATVCCVSNKSCCYNAFRGPLPGCFLGQAYSDWSAVFGFPRALSVPTTLAQYYLIFIIISVLYVTAFSYIAMYIYLYVCYNKILYEILRYISIFRVTVLM